jgi:hypothetical protein
LARLFAGAPGSRDTTFHIADQQALTSLVTFNIGASIGRLGDKLSPKSRLWLVLSTFLQTLFTLAAALTIWHSNTRNGSVADNRGTPAWDDPLSFVGLGFMSASLGLQGITAKRLNTQFTTTVVLTTVWVELMADPDLFRFRRFVITRDHKLIAVAALFLGGFTSRALVDQIGAAGALGVGTGVRLCVTLSWMFIPGENKSRA